MSPIIGTVHRELSREGGPGFWGSRVVISAVLRGEEVLRDDRQIGELQVGDRLEVFPILREHMEERLSWASHNARPIDMEATGTTWALPRGYGGTVIFERMTRAYPYLN
jgi:hypothetical protein